MFVTRSRYDNVKKECSNQVNEILGLRRELKAALESKEKLEEKIDELYNQARIDAETKSKFAAELVEAKKDIQRFKQLKQDMSVLKVDIKEYMNPEPIDTEERKLYVSRIAGYFDGGLRDYIRYLRTNFTKEIARFPISEKEADFHRAGINLCYLLEEWGDTMCEEHLANMREGKDTVDTFDTSDTDESVENIKSAINR